MIGCTVAWLEDNLTFAEFNEWIAFLTFQAELESGKEPARLIEADSAEKLGEMQELAFFGDVTPRGKPA